MDEEVIIKDNDRGKAEFYLATVENWYPSTREAQITLDGDDARMTKRYKTACGSVSVGSRVVVMKMSGTYVVLGAINETTYKRDISGVATAASGITLYSGGYVARWGKVAMLYLRFQVSETFSSTTKLIATLSEGWRPAIPADAQYWDGAGGFIDTSGRVYVYGNASSTSSYYTVYATYILA